MTDTLLEALDEFTSAAAEQISALQRDVGTLAKEISVEGLPVDGDPETYTAMTRFIRAVVELEVKKATLGSPADLGDVPVRCWSGIWREGRSYERGTLTTRSGATWLATRPTMVQPGVNDSGWKMIAKGDK